MSQKVLIIGSGGREHALAWKLSRSQQVKELYVAPGNAGTAEIATNVPMAVTNLPGLAAFAKDHLVDLTVVGPDDVLAGGIVDLFQSKGLRIYGPTKSAARIESSKAFSKYLMTRQNVPTATFKTFKNAEAAKDYAKSHTLPVVIKASGLALGKGVYICQTYLECDQAIADIMESKVFGESGSEVVIEDFLSGREVSIHAFCDGKTAVLFPTAQDHKQIGTGDIGPNTGGMGVISPLNWVTDAQLTKVKKVVVDPILRGLNQSGSPFVGTLYPGLMVGDKGLNVLEFNARFGDPETQSYMRLLQSDLLDVLNACVDGKLAAAKVIWSDQYCVNVVLASGGYPGAYKKGLPITGLKEASSLPGVVVFHAGTAVKDGQVVTAGGRVLAVSAIGETPIAAQQKAYEAAALIHFEGVQFRTDIGSKSL
jgi:phosphoribosylamine---glycine ligase